MLFFVDVYADEFAILRPAETNTQTLSLPLLGRAMQTAQLGFVQDVIATTNELCLTFADRSDASGIDTLDGKTFSLKHSSRQFQLPIWFDDHDDWQTVCDVTGQDKATIIRRLTDTSFVVAMLGFMPGFVYLDGLPPEFHIPRKATPTTSIAPQTLAIGGPYLGIYSLPTPAGWYAIGRLAQGVFQQDADHPLLVEPGDRIVLKMIDEDHYRQLVNAPKSLVATGE